MGENRENREKNQHFGGVQRVGVRIVIGGMGKMAFFQFRRVLWGEWGK